MRRCFRQIPGLVWRKKDGGQIISNPSAEPLDMNSLPFLYEGTAAFENRIIYYESGRGCPFSCSYCLSSIDKSNKIRSPEKVCRELQFFLDERVPQVKFVDRTFNCRKSHAMAIWTYLLEHDNGVTNHFHFEIAADLLDDDELNLIRRMRPGLDPAGNRRAVCKPEDAGSYPAQYGFLGTACPDSGAGERGA